MTDSIWSNLSAINVNEHVEKKGKFNYLSWTWAWATVKEHYPEANFTLEDDTNYPDQTMEVRVTVTIDGMSHTCWLPVLDFNNKAISNPGAFAINSARMRCLVKCLAFFGLGHYIYAGESLPPGGESQKIGEDITEVSQLLRQATSLDELQATFKMAWNSYPNSRADLTKIKDAIKRGLVE